MKAIPIALSACLWLLLVAAPFPAGQFAHAKVDTGELQWHTFLGGVGSDYGRHIIKALDDNLLIVGQSNARWGSPIRAFQGNSDAFIARLDENGNLMWNTFLGGTGADSASSIALSSNGGMYIVGTSNNSWGNPIRSFSGNYLTDNGFVAFVDAIGNLRWHTFLGSGFRDQAISLVTTIDNEVIVVGESEKQWGNPLRPIQGNSNVFMAWFKKPQS